MVACINHIQSVKVIRYGLGHAVAALHPRRNPLAHRIEELSNLTGEQYPALPIGDGTTGRIWGISHIGPALPASLGEVLPLGKQKLRIRDPAVALVAGDQPAAVRLVRILHIVKGSIAIRRSVSLVLARAIKSGETWAM